ncbi:MAG: putative polysaccharide biosynthesis protein [bacterium]
MSFLHGALVLTLAGLCSKIIGAVYRVPLSYLLGAEGIGLYQMAYPFYSIAFILAASGIPIAVAKLSAEQIAHGRHDVARLIFKVALVLLAITGFCSSLVLYLLAPVLANRILGDPRALYPLRAIAPAVFLIAIQVALRGYFQGMQKMAPIAGSQVVEQVVRVTTMLGLAYVLLPRGLEYAAAGATFGAVTGALAGNFLLGALYLRSLQSVGRLSVGVKDMAVILGDIIRLALPITFGAFIMPVMDTVDAVIVPLRLQAIGFTVRQATALYGQLSGMAVSLLLFPTVITAAFAFSLIPAISEAVALKKGNLVSRRVEEALGVTVLVGLPATVGLYLLPTEICQLLFQTPEAGGPLTFLAFGCFFLCLQQTTTGILQGLGRASVPVQSIFLGACCNAVLNYYLTVIPALNIKGAALGTGIGFTVAALFNLRAVGHLAGIRLSLRDLLLRPLAATIGMAVAVKVVYAWFWSHTGGSPLAVLPAILIGGAVYFLLALLTGAVPWRYLAYIPFIGFRRRD